MAAIQLPVPQEEGHCFTVLLATVRCLRRDTLFHVVSSLARELLHSHTVLLPNGITQQGR
jgi:hypothetical protein